MSCRGRQDVKISDIVQSSEVKNLKIIPCEKCTCCKCSNKKCEYYCKNHKKDCDMGIDTNCDYFKPKNMEE
ncbi:hypothetical protein FDB15_18615 [Clostridium botulinum]|uniref:hypothetical protein n=1 Tax=unclassified Clostridium TaxID=2614128 RepID=UPI0013CC1A8F|nr:MULTISPECIES: hypothetical protein [unclassified Clostridium]MBY6986445.1 hypothetical protein [Clostridium botulinum]MBY7009089.1 hypothetical protein [Clostridium botulinum]NFJ45658.1 hypothetical protein [Clostridium botulinum]NFK31145.1 hypothetical protein [Clostridium botulinum]NFK52398.1 hypothetical protein [Clostridium botulinum]